jgi:hypothetical protein
MALGDLSGQDSLSECPSHYPIPGRHAVLDMHAFALNYKLYILSCSRISPRVLFCLHCCRASVMLGSGNNTQQSVLHQISSTAHNVTVLGVQGLWQTSNLHVGHAQARQMHLGLEREKSKAAALEEEVQKLKLQNQIPTGGAQEVWPSFSLFVFFGVCRLQLKSVAHPMCHTPLCSCFSGTVS